MNGWSMVQVRVNRDLFIRNSDSDEELVQKSIKYQQNPTLKLNYIADLCISNLLLAQVKGIAKANNINYITLLENSISCYLKAHKLDKYTI